MALCGARVKTPRVSSGTGLSPARQRSRRSPLVRKRITVRGILSQYVHNHFFLLDWSRLYFHIFLIINLLVFVCQSIYAVAQTVLPKPALTAPRMARSCAKAATSVTPSTQPKPSVLVLVRYIYTCARCKPYPSPPPSHFQGGQPLPRPGP